jgi:hypothetical protein
MSLEENKVRKVKTPKVSSPEAVSPQQQPPAIPYTPSQQPVYQPPAGQPPMATQLPPVSPPPAPPAQPPLGVQAPTQPTQVPSPGVQPAAYQQPTIQPPPAQVPSVQPQIAKPKTKARRTKPGRRKTKKGKTTEMPSEAKEKMKFSKVRYRTRIIKGSVLPILFGLLSLLMLNNYVLEFPEYYEYNTLMILFGFLLGFGSLSGITISNLVKAKGKQAKGINYHAAAYLNGIDLNVTKGVAVFLPFIIIAVILALYLGLATAWQFSMGFFFAAIFPILIVVFYEVSSKGKFFVHEGQEGISEIRKLVFVPS